MKATHLVAALSGLLLQGQPAIPKWDVVSVKKCTAASARRGDSSPGRLSIGCGCLAGTDNTGIIQVAYNRYARGYFTSSRVMPIEGVPEWVHEESFDIEAKTEGHPNITMMQGPMMQQILEDRFKLKIRRETRQGPVYELTLGKDSSRLKPFQPGRCRPNPAGRPSAPLADGERYCRAIVSPQGLDMEAGTLTGVADMLGMVLDRPVIDKTGIPDLFEVHLRFSPDDSPERRSAVDPTAPAETSPDAPGIFQAIQAQLGLKLVPAKGPVDVLVIDHIERPTEN
jgi:uncharacterized protein (TIGR03435 family)